MTHDEIKAAAMQVVSELKLPPVASILAYERIVAFGVDIAAKFAPPPAPKRKKGQGWSPEAIARFRNDPVRMERARALAASARAKMVAKALAK